MPRRKTIHRRSKKYAIGDLNNRITLHKRDITAPVFNSSAPTESYTTGTEVWASVNTLDFANSDIEQFDKVNLSEAPSHKFVIRYREFLKDGLTAVTKETIVRWQNIAYKIISIRNPEWRNEYLELFSKLLGDQTKEVNK